MKYLKYFLISIAIIAIDQALKLWVHQNMFLGEEIMIVDDWFRLLYVLNPGFAYGLKLDWEYGKLALSLFRLVATGFIAWYLYKLIKEEMPKGLLVCLAMVLGGATGNLIDSVFYGVWFNNAPYGSLFDLFHGQVIDMFYFPIWEGYLPDWLPFKGGDYFIFFRPVFNVADAFVFTGFATILLFQKKLLKEKSPKQTNIESSSIEKEEPLL